MRARTFYTVIALACLAAVCISSTAWALDEAILTPTNDNIKAVEEQAFNEAMNVWFSHRYADGEKLLAEFAKKHPESRWRAEAEMHRGCYLTYLGQSETAKPVPDIQARGWADREEGR